MTGRVVLDEFFAARGDCALCGDTNIGSRHRIVDAIAESVIAGDDVDSVAKEFGYPRDAVVYAVGFVEGWKMGRKRRKKS